MNWAIDGMEAERPVTLENCVTVPQHHLRRGRGRSTRLLVNCRARGRFKGAYTTRLDTARIRDALPRTKRGADGLRPWGPADPVCRLLRRIERKLLLAALGHRRLMSTRIDAGTSDDGLDRWFS